MAFRFQMAALRGNVQFLLPFLTVVCSGMLSFVILAPPSCSSVPQCSIEDASRPVWHHGIFAVGLSVLLAREVSGLIAMALVVRNIKVSVWSLQTQCLAPLVFCIVLIVLSSVEAILATQPVVWSHAAAHGPVYSIRYAEWLVDVPLLLILTGFCAMQQPMKKIIGPMVVTELYIIASWAALFVNSEVIRWTLVVAVFVAFGWATWEMYLWVKCFLGDTDLESPLPARRACIASVFLLIAVFGIYGMIYLLALTGVISALSEHLAYTCMGFAAKLSLSMIFYAIRTAEHEHALSTLLCKIGGVSSAFVSLLRGSFDFVVPCVADANGICQLPNMHCGDSKELEQCLGRIVLGSSLNDQLVEPSEKAPFAAYVQNALKQVETSQADESRQNIAGALPLRVEMLRFGEGQMPPVAHVIRVKLRRGATVALKESLSALVHISVVPDDGPQKLWRVIAAFQLTPQDHSCYKADTEEVPEWTDPTMDLTLKSSQAPSTKDSSHGASTRNLDTASELTSLSSSLRKQSKSSHQEECDRELSESEEPSVRHPKRKQLEMRKRNSRTLKMVVRLLARKSKRKGSKPTSSASSADNSSQDHLERGSWFSVPESKVSSKKVSFRFGGSDVGSQSSRLSCVGSVTQACRQLLGPLHDQLPPQQLRSKRIEDHLLCAAEMVRLRACAKFKHIWHEQRVEEWQEQVHNHEVSTLLKHSSGPSEQFPEQVWREQVLPLLQAPSPGVKPKAPQLPDDNELWYEAWKRTYEDGEEDSDASDSSSVVHAEERETFYTDGRVRR